MIFCVVHMYFVQTHIYEGRGLGSSNLFQLKLFLGLNRKIRRYFTFIPQHSGSSIVDATATVQPMVHGGR